MKCPSDRLPHYLASPECQPSPLPERGHEDASISPPPGCVESGGGAALAKGSLILSEALELQGSPLIKGCVISVRDNKPSSLRFLCRYAPHRVRLTGVGRQEGGLLLNLPPRRKQRRAFVWRIIKALLRYFFTLSADLSN